MELDIDAERVFQPRKSYLLAQLVTIWIGAALWGAYRSIEIVLLGSSFMPWDRWGLICAGLLALATLAAFRDSRLARLSRLSLSAWGITVRRGRKTRGFAWSDIELAERIEIRPLEGENYWAIAIRPSSSLGGRRAAISLEGFDVDPDELLDLIQGHLSQKTGVRAQMD